MNRVKAEWMSAVTEAAYQLSRGFAHSAADNLARVVADMMPLVNQVRIDEIRKAIEDKDVGYTIMRRGGK